MPSALTSPVSGGSPNPVGSLTASAKPLDESADWQAFGVEHVPEACQGAWVWQKCSEVDGETVAAKPLNDGVDAVRFQPFLVEANAAACPGGIQRDSGVLAERASRILKWNASRQIGLAFSSATPDGYPNVNPNLTDSAVDATPGGGPANLVNTISGLLEDAIACGLNGDLFIHAPHWTLPHWLTRQLVEQVGSTFKLGGHTVVLDQGYANEPPNGGPNAGVGEAWIYVTSPVEYATGSVVQLADITDGYELRLNRANKMAAQLAIYRFDPCCVRAARARVC